MIFYKHSSEIWQSKELRQSRGWFKELPFSILFKISVIPHHFFSLPLTVIFKKAFWDQRTDQVSQNWICVCSHRNAAFNPSSMSCALSQLTSLSLWLLIKNSHYTTECLAELILLYIKRLQKWGRKYTLPQTGAVLIMTLSFSRWENIERLGDCGRLHISSV